MNPHTSNIENSRVLLETELEMVIGGVTERQAWVSLAAAHGFNPQPDPPAIWASQTLASSSSRT
jgi:hypothetical protein